MDENVSWRRNKFLQCTQNLFLCYSIAYIRLVGVIRLWIDLSASKVYCQFSHKANSEKNIFVIISPISLITNAYFFHTVSQFDLHPRSKETIVKLGILRKAFWVFKT